MSKQVIHFQNAPKSIGICSQAIKVDQINFVSGQIPLEQITMEVVRIEIDAITCLGDRSLDMAAG